MITHSMGVDPAIVERHLRRLPTEALAALVADLWAARGYDTRREATRVIASRGDEQVVLAVAGAAPGGDVDVVVATDGADRVDATANEFRVLDAAALREVLWYAVDRETTRALCARHLGAPPAELGPPAGLGRTVSRRLDRLRPVTTRIAGVARPGVVVLAVAIAGVVLAAAIGQPPAGGGATGAAATDAAVSTDTPAAVPTDERSVYPGLGAVPGVDDSGVTEPAALSAAHDRALESQYTVWMDVYWRPNGTDTASERQRDIDITVEEDRYLLRAEVEADGPRRPALSVYRNGPERYVATYGDGHAATRRLPPGQDVPAWVPEPDRLRLSIGTQFLATPTSTVTGVVRQDGRTYYRVAGSGTPPAPLPRPGNGTAPPPTVGNYTVVALVTTDGVVADLEARYTVDRPAGTLPVRVQATYDRRGRTTVERPDWYAAAAANGSVTPAGGATPAR